jgi:methylated-DNA-[protein]-cysteine S-methyltransferase
MDTRMKYTIFNTDLGYFGLLASEKGLCRTVLPCKTRKNVQKKLLFGIKNARFERNLFKFLQKQVVSYYKGKAVRFDTAIAPDGLAPFTWKVLKACKKIPAGKTVSYSQLAGMIGKPKASRAVGTALAKNPIPLIIPCHRVIHCDGSLGNFSAPGGTSTKKKLLELEKR